MKILLNLILCFCFITNAFAQELQKNLSYIFDDFSGGLATKLSILQIDKKYSDIAENIRFDSSLKALTKRDKILDYGTASDSNPILGMHRFYLNDGSKVLLTNYSNKVSKGNDSTGIFTDILTLAQADRKWQWLTWHNIAIGTDGYNQPVKYDGISSSATYLGTVLALDAGTGAGPNGSYTYKVTCYTASTEYSLGVASNTVIVSNKDINLSMIPICPDTIVGVTVVGRKIYRTEASGSSYKLLSNGTIANNTAVTLTDSDADAALGAVLNPTATYVVPKGRLSVIHKNRLWLANDPDNPSRIYYSEDSSHDFFLPDAYFDIRQSDGDSITFVKNVLGKLTIGKNNTIQKIYTDGDDPAADWEISDPFSFVGNHAIYSAVNTPIGLVYLSNNGIYSFNGQYSELLSDQVTPEIRDISSSNIVNVWGEYFKNSYYLSYTATSTGSSTNNRVLVMDMISKAFSIDTLSINVFHVLRSGNDVEVLYSGSSSNGKIYAHSDATKEIVHRRFSDFTGTFTDSRYIPLESGGDSESPILEIARIGTIDSLVGTIDSLIGSIDRGSLSGNYISQALTLNANRLDKLYWNEVLPTSGSNVTFAIRTATSDSALSSASWSSEFSDPSGSDISTVTGNVVGQYRISMTTDTYEQTPNIVKANNYNIKMTYNISGGSSESAVILRYRTGWLDFGAPGYKKTLRKIYVYYQGESEGTFTIQFENYEGNTDTFTIDQQQYPSEYTAYFANGAFTGELLRMTIQESSLNDFKIRRIQLVYDIEPLI